MTRRRASPTLVLDNGQVCCAACNHGLVPIGQSWKPKARLNAVAVASLPGAGMGIDQKLELRLFTCPACAALLDSETALPEDPVLEDIIFA